MSAVTEAVKLAEKQLELLRRTLKKIASHSQYNVGVSTMTEAETFISHLPNQRPFSDDDLITAQKDSNTTITRSVIHSSGLSIFRFADNSHLAVDDASVYLCRDLNDSRPLT